MIIEMSSIFGAAVVGSSLGVILLTLSNKYNKKTLGWTGFFLCLIGHVTLGFLASLPCFAIVFSLIFKDGEKQ